MIKEPKVGQRVAVVGKAHNPAKPVLGRIVSVIERCDPYVDLILDSGSHYLADKNILEEVES